MFQDNKANKIANHLTKQQPNKTRKLFYSWEDTESISKPKQGYAIIFNHYKYANGFPPERKGTEYDVKKLQEVFDYYNFDTNVKHDLKLNDIKRQITYLQYKDFSKFKCFVIVVLTHGGRNETVCANDRSYNFIDTIENPLLKVNKSLFDIPKIFVIQACRGSEENPVFETDSLRPAVPKQNFFKCNATYEGLDSWRDITSGTIFIQNLCKKLLDIGKTQTIQVIMMKVIEEVSSDDTLAQVPTITPLMKSPFCFGTLLN